eukprot:CAMPEP_0196188116 /NCGR_PEP_ID=MMETSP0911-20130528/41609_1 /TAXON_ID=49265 /ORGANISM="Thalassiosira rotula, Strain GSO102" /LENGTH=80 /DNA_ID=CAMNT_0041459367 /DNA_START=188 /DNA_END=426 /DNA_ORIENTATION=+
MARAYAKVNVSHPHLFKKVANDILIRDFKIFKPQELSNIVWAYATAGEFSPRLSKPLSDHIVQRDFKLFKPQDLSDIVWA